MLPILILGIISWLKNSQKNDDGTTVVIINKLSLKETLLALLGVTIFGVAFYFILLAFNSRFILLFTFISATLVLGTYFIARRSYYGFVANFFKSILRIALWISVLLENGGDFSIAILLFLPVILLINDVYGLINWIRLHKKQNQNSDFEKLSNISDVD